MSEAPRTTDEELMAVAIAVRERAHAPYSRYRVGAAVEDESGAVHVGCNVENTAFPAGSCAEANAIAAMVAGGGRKVVAIAVAGGGEELEVCTPCGGCRQRIFEFADHATRVITRDGDGRHESHGLAELLPSAIRPL